MQADPAPGLLTASLRLPWQLCTDQRSLIVADHALQPFRCRWIEDYVVNGLYQLQLNYAFHLVGHDEMQRYDN